MMNRKREAPQGQAQVTSNGSGGDSRLKTVMHRGGFYYALLYSTRWLIRKTLDRIDHRLIGIEQRRGLVEPWAISANRFTAQENKRLWNEHDWSSLGEEWTKSAEWKERIIQEFLVPHVPEGATVLEIGPGGGRWTELLQSRAGKLVVVDVAERAIALCRERFADCSNIEYLVGDGRTIDVPDDSIDVIWSFDVFVHINPLDAQTYFREFRRILRPGGHALIHHNGALLPSSGSQPGWRSDLTEEMVREFIQENDLHLVSQIHSELVKKADTVTVFEKPARAQPE
jgi:ubiquinone/menaquinone biosynthesis C-methylase UbiE